MRAPVMVICVFAVGLLGLITYSQYRPMPAVVSGFVEADLIRLGSRVGGRVAVCNVSEGECVEAGDVLVEVEPFDLLARRAAAVAESRLLELGTREAELEAARASVDGARKAFELARS